MQTITDFMIEDHHSCDEEFAYVEQTALAGDWIGAASRFKTFQLAMTKHFGLEEDVIFPKLISAGGPTGPVSVMRVEHAQMKSLIEQMADALSDQNSMKFGGISETLLVTMQQHNLKEEQILYPLCDQILSSERAELLKVMRIGRNGNQWTP